MKTKSFKTNITCTGCIDKVTPVLNEVAGEGNWEVDLRTKSKTLTIKSEELDEEKMKKDLSSLGYKAEEISTQDVSQS